MLEIISKTLQQTAILHIIDKNIKEHVFTHVISLNPENYVEASMNVKFYNAFQRAEIVIADGVGIVLASKILRIPCGDRISGVDLMSEIIKRYQDRRIVFFGGQKDASTRTRNHFNQITSANHSEWQSIEDAQKDDPDLIHKVVAFKPDIVFIAFGSPAQELWIEKNRHLLQGVMCMGVGQGMDVYGGYVARAPQLVRFLGLEWLYRLITQPWRWKRQLKLLQFIYLVIRDRLEGTR